MSQVCRTETNITGKLTIRLIDRDDLDSWHSAQKEYTEEIAVKVVPSSEDIGMFLLVMNRTASSRSATRFYIPQLL